MKYLIIGGCGFIGTNFAEKHLARGDDVIIIDNLSRKGTTTNLEYLQEKFPHLQFIHADIRVDKDRIVDVINDVDVVYHLAAQVAVTSSVSNPWEDFNINALGTFHILEAIRESKKQPILIFASTNKVYGGMEDIEIEEKNNRYEYKGIPNGIAENRILDFHSPYGCSKGAADQYVRDYARIYGMKTVVMRQSCIYGPRQFGVEDQGWVAWFTIASILGKKITVYGDGKQIRDVLHVDDLFCAWDNAVKKIRVTSGRVYNVGGGSGKTMSLLELIVLLEELLKKKIPHSFSDWRPGDQPVYVSDIAKIKKDIHWEPKITVRDGVNDLYRWIQKNKKLIEKVL